MIHVCLTYDYELFLGEQFCSEEKTLIEPTSMLLDMFDENEIPITLFVDTCCLMSYKKNGLCNFPEKAEIQLLSAIENGHDVQLHVHPHWISSKYNDSKWNYNDDSYRIHYYGEKGISKIISENVAYLNDLICSVKSDYKCIAYRAGGYCMQPEQYLIKCLYENGIRIDSSVCFGGYNNTKTLKYNYLNVPKNTAWYFSINEGINKIGQIEDKCILEIPICGIRGVNNKLSIRKNRKTISENINRGTFINSGINKGLFKTYSEKVFNFVRTSYLLQLDSYDYKTLCKMFNMIISDYNIEKEDVYFSIIGHPKMQGEKLINNTELFIKEIKNQYKDLICFDTMTKVAKNERLL